MGDNLELRAVYRILDANLDRAREGLRVIEEWCRLGLNQREWSLICKEMRQELASWHRLELRQARDTPGDPGTTLTHPQEEQRDSIQQVLQANLGRTQEALRVIEEYGKLYHAGLAQKAKQIRYQVYTLESKLLDGQRNQQLNEAVLYLVTSPRENLLNVVEAALKGGLTLVQYRDKNNVDTVRLEQAQQLSDLCHRYGALFLMNDRPDLALAVNADGVHLGQEDAPIALARRLLGAGKIVGKSTTNPAEMERAIADGADYIGVGPVFATPTKPGKAAAGFEYVHYAAEKAPIPWFAIGGIDQENINEVINNGARRVAVVRAIMEAEQPTQITQSLLKQLKDSPFSLK